MHRWQSGTRVTARVPCPGVALPAHSGLPGLRAIKPQSTQRHERAMVSAETRRWRGAAGHADPSAAIEDVDLPARHATAWSCGGTHGAQRPRPRAEHDHPPAGCAFFFRNLTGDCPCGSGRSRHDRCRSWGRQRPVGPSCCKDLPRGQREAGPSCGRSGTDSESGRRAPCAPGSDVRLCVQVEVHEADFFYSLGIDQVQHDHADQADDHEAADPQRHFGIRR